MHFLFRNILIDEADAVYYGVTCTIQKNGRWYAPYQLDFMQSAYVQLVFLGTLFYCTYGSIGLIAVPLDYAADYYYRPTPINQKEFDKRKKHMLPKLYDIRKHIKHIDNERYLVEKVTGLSGFTKRLKFNSHLRFTEKEAIFYQVEFEKMESQADFANKVEPMLYCWRICQSIMTTILSLNIFVILMLDIITQISDEPITKYNYMEMLNVWVEQVHKEDGINLMALSNWTFVFFSFYMLWTATYGNKVLGERFGWFTYEPIRKNETQLNAMLYEVMLKNTLAAAILQMSVMNMRTYTRGSTIYLLCAAVECTDLFFNIANCGWDLYALLICMLAWAAFLFKKGANRVDFEQEFYLKQKAGEDLDAPFVEESSDEY